MKERGEDFRKAPVEFEWHPGYLHNNHADVHMDKNGNSTLEGLYCAGDVIGVGWPQSAGGALVFGARAGSSAAIFAKTAELSKVDNKQVENETAHIRNAISIVALTFQNSGIGSKFIEFLIEYANKNT